jgi:KaiC/GvpD/RAD55 family RecA-like ATPase
MGDKPTTSRNPAVAPLPFGIPQLDQLFNYPGLAAPELKQLTLSRTSLAIVGPDGTGKSVFGLHLASSYHAVLRHRWQKNFLANKANNSDGEAVPNRVEVPEGCPPLVLYISTDLRFAAAKKVWDNFYLDYPWQRFSPFASSLDVEFRRRLLAPTPPSVFRVDLEPCTPRDAADGLKKPLLNAVGRHLTAMNSVRDKYASEASVVFLDLASDTTGDDWLFVARLMASLPKHPAAPPHLLVLDSVAGMETLVGERNSFGEEMSRRARIAQLLRAAGENWHTVFIVEEPEQGKHLPEEYVTDTVLHLRRYAEGDHTRRVLHIEKCRARSYALGEHPFEIRDGSGSTTGSWENSDDPFTLPNASFWKSQQHKLDGRPPYNAYVQIFPSLQHLSREFGRQRSLTAPDHDAGRRVPFNIPYLDNMLAKDEKHWRRSDIQTQEDSQHTQNEKEQRRQYGLPEGSISALIGDEGTRKSCLAERFLTEAFTEFPTTLKEVLRLAQQYKAGLGDTDILKFLMDRANEKKLPEIEYRGHGALQKIIRDRDRLDLGRRHSGLQDLAQQARWRLLVEEELKDLVSAMSPTTGRGHEAIVKDEQTGVNGERRRPLMRRWDEKFYYEDFNLLAAADPGQAHAAFVLTLSILRISWGFLPAVVFLTTHDHSSEDIARAVICQHEAEIEAILKESRVPNRLVAIAHLRRLLERFIIVRRIELIDATAPQLWHILHQAASDALRLTAHELHDVENSVEPLPYAGRIRVVISDLRLIRDTYPSVAADPLFLPTIVFRLRRLGATTLIVDSSDGRPDMSPSHPMNGALRSLVDHQIYTWKVPFFGEQRVAISVIPSLSGDGSSVIRELRVEMKKDAVGENVEDVKVDPHFELYAGLEKGDPQAVPLQVLLYSETPAFEEYIEQERALFAHIFSSVPSAVPGTAPVIQVQKTHDYDGLRDYCHMPIGTRLPYTMVFMVDGYWALGRDSSLQFLNEYLFGELKKERYGRVRYDRFMDVFRLYRLTRQRDEEDGAPALRAYQLALETLTAEALETEAPRPDRLAENKLVETSLSRVDFFRQPFNGPNFEYKTRLCPEFPSVNRVPFMWDFGFLLCNERQWNNAAGVALPSTLKGKARHVGDVWKKLVRVVALEVHDANWKKPDQPKRSLGSDRIRTLSRKQLLGLPTVMPPKHQKRSQVSWREFLEACVVVAKVEEQRTGQRVMPFDLAMSAADSLSCFFYELWFSEILKDANCMRDHAAGVERTRPDLARRARRWADRADWDLGLFSVEEYRGQKGMSTPDHPFCDGQRYLQELLGWDARAGCFTTMFGQIGKEWERQFKSCPEESAPERFISLYTLGDSPDSDFRPGDPPGKYGLQLYKVWLLLLEVMEFGRYYDPERPFELKTDLQPVPTAVAARHWYKTACLASQGDLSAHGGERVVHTQVPVRLPGSFSVRGDWFLAVAKGSRSSRLGDRALDLLTSRRANRTRLHLGMGLPTRDLLEEDTIGNIRTRLTVSTPDAVHDIYYGHLLRLKGKFAIRLDGKHGDPQRELKSVWGYGVDSAGRVKKTDRDSDEDPFYWLQRTGFRDYDRHSLTIRRWVHRVLTWTVQYRYEHRESWEGGFSAYDQLSRGDFSIKDTYDSFTAFAHALDIFADDLNHCSLREEV